jgi:septal ring factor EnvC (AmiA/AmiB activator)
MGEIYTHKDKDGTILIYDQLNGPNFKTKDLQGTNENKSNETEPQLKGSGPRKIFEQESAGQQTDRDVCLSNLTCKSRIETLRSQILSSEERIETLHSQNRSQKERIESFNSQIQSSGETIVTPLNLYPEEKTKQINSSYFNKVIREEKEALDKHRQELSRYQKKYSEIQQEIKRRNIDCTRDD